MPVDEATRSRDALAKHIYARVFEWVVDNINQVRQSHLAYVSVSPSQRKAAEQSVYWCA